jgi:hypothetical protein
LSSAGYSGTPLWKKLGLKPGGRLTLLDAPEGFTVGDLPDGATIAREGARAGRTSAAELIVAFCGELVAVRKGVERLSARIHPDGALWVAWPRKAAGHESDVSEQAIRDAALPLGLVDVKVAALDEHWSGLRLVWRKERRDASPRTRG